jgi:hypothetical protein
VYSGGEAAPFQNCTLRLGGTPDLLRLDAEQDAALGAPVEPVYATEGTRS